jgi:hypothetical protein
MITTGMVTGLDLVCFKLAGEALKAGESILSFFVMFNFLMGIFMAVTNVVIVNVAMGLYYQMDVMLMLKAMDIVF